MQWRCRTIPLTRMIVSNKGFLKPLCNSCKSKDCDNPIENTQVSILGINENIRVYNNKLAVSLVIQCEGYIA